MHPHPTPRGYHGARGWAPCAIELLRISYLLYTWECNNYLTLQLTVFAFLIIHSLLHYLLMI